jgi:SrtB family sortase
MLTSALAEYGKSASAYSLVAAKAHEPLDGEKGGGRGFGSVKEQDDAFARITEAAPGAKAWLSGEGTPIDYPVMQGADNTYYLHHLFDGTQSKVGSLFIDYECDPRFTDRNTVIYGHNMADGSMLASLNGYKAQSYADEHSEFRLVTPDGVYRIEVFSAFAASPAESGTDMSPWALDWPDTTGFVDWLLSMKGRSLITSDVTPIATDRIVTLCTCTDGGRERFIVMGRLTC